MSSPNHGNPVAASSGNLLGDHHCPIIPPASETSLAAAVEGVAPLPFWGRHLRGRPKLWLLFLE
jgi:hypothetical protein